MGAEAIQSMSRISLSCMDKLNKANLLLRESTELIPETIRKYSKQTSLGDLSDSGDPPDSYAKPHIFLSYRLAIISLNWSKSFQKITAIHSF